MQAAVPAVIADYDARRGTSAERGYGHRWRCERLVFLAANPLCVRCLAADETTGASVVDHIQPHKGCQLLFWDRGNWQALCKPCHDRKTVAEDGGLKPGRVAWHPEWLQQTRAALTIVSGAPGSGKSTWLADKAGRDDVVICLDQIGAAMCGTSTHQWSRRKLIEIGRERNRRIMGLAEPSMAGRTAWLVVSEPMAEWRQWWVSHVGARRVVVLETPAAECIRRMQADPERPRTTGKTVEAWWRRYRRRPGDEIVMP